MLFSVIVPIYNIENYLKRCIDSVLEQSFSDYELILVDDGSPDSCPSICDEYAKNNDKIKVIHKKNGGLVSARQAGIKEATGEYIFNLDGDDSLLPDALKTASDIITKTGADIISFSYKVFADGKICETVEDLADEGLYEGEKLSQFIYPKILSDKNMHHIFYYLCIKAIKRDLLTPHQLNVNPAISLGEDLSCLVPCYLDAKSVYISKTPVYLYTKRYDSISKDFKTQQITQIADVIEGLKKIDASKVPSDFDEQISRYSCFMCFAIIAAAAQGGHFKALKKIKELIKTTVHKEELPKARFEKVTIKSRIAIFLIKRLHIKSAFYFLYLCSKLKRERKGDNQ